MGNGIPSLLIVDDEKPVLDLLVKALRPKYDCTTTSNVGEAIDLLRSKAFDLVIADIGLPDSSGFVIPLFVSTMCPQTAVVMISGRSDEQAVAEAMQKGACDFIIKPFEISEVGRIVNQALQYRASVSASA